MSKGINKFGITTGGADIPGSHHYGRSSTGLALTLDNGRRVYLADSNDCCAFTELEWVVKHLDKIDHVIMGVGTTEGYRKWHIYADLGDVLELSVNWSPGNPFYYGYGFDIVVVDPVEVVLVREIDLRGKDVSEQRLALH